MQYEKTIMELLTIQMNDIVCVSDGGFGDNDDDFARANQEDY